MRWQPVDPPDPHPLRTTGRGFYDLQTLVACFGDVADERTRPEFLYHVQTYHHERCHYLQHLGTTLGACLGLLRFDRLQNFTEWIQRFSPDVRTSLTASRTAGRAIVPFERSSDHQMLTLGFRPGDPEDVDIFRQIIFDNCLFWWLLYDMRTAQEIAGHQPSEVAVPLVLRDVHLRAHKFFGTPARKDRGTLCVPDLWSPFYVEDGSPFGTPSLLEGAALANEFHFLLRSGVSRDIVHERFDRIIKDTYGVALRHYMQCAGVPGRDEMLADPYTHLWFFLIAVDVAINPELPPVVTGTSHSWNWSELNPAHRFCKALKNLWVFDIVAPRSPEEAVDHTVVSRAVDELARACGFAQPSTFRFPSTGGTRLKLADFMFDDFRPTNFSQSTFRSHLEAGYDPYEYAVLLHRQAWAERGTNLPAVVFSGLLGGQYYDKDRPEALLHSGQCRPGLFFPPLILNSTSGLFSPSLGTDANHAGALAYGSIRDKLFESYFWSTGPVALRGEWQAVGGAYSAFQRSVETELAELFGQPVSVPPGHPGT